MCYCGTVKKSGLFKCCTDLMAEKGGREFVDSFIKKDEKNKVASAYMPKEEEAMKVALNTVPPANETPREELLQRDVGILFTENQRLKKAHDDLLEANKILLEQNENLFKSFKRIFAENGKLLSKAGKQNADM